MPFDAKKCGTNAFGIPVSGQIPQIQYFSEQDEGRRLQVVFIIYVIQ